ncbi:MAG: UDP-2,3-diacylglucosamine diphosphatase [Nitrospirota bacterium]|nr:UDP-2,3-diacylglucosamine diphosphatase [Nitrospirota bacterium]
MLPAQAIFISDAHLSQPGDANYQRMLAFLGGLADLPGGLPELFILGDFFAFWMGFASVPERYRPVVESLQQLSATGTRLHFVEGNHDLDLGRFFAHRLGATVHPDQAVVTLGGRRLLLAHGDLVDPSDRGYRFLRAALRSLPMKMLSRTVPPEGVLSIARRFAENKRYTASYAAHLPPLFSEYARGQWMEGFDGVVLGHCHHPVFEQEEAVEGRRPRFYVNLGDWIRHFTYLRFDGADFHLERA